MALGGALLAAQPGTAVLAQESVGLAAQASRPSTRSWSPANVPALSPTSNPVSNAGVIGNHGITLLPTSAVTLPASVIASPDRIAITLSAKTRAAADATASGTATVPAENTAPQAPGSLVKHLIRLTHGLEKSVAGLSLRRFFDSGKGAGDEAPLPSDVKVFMTSHGREPRAIDLEELPQALTADPSYAKELNAKGLVRLVLTAKAKMGLTKASVPALERALKVQGVTAKISVEVVPTNSAPVEIIDPAAPGSLSAGSSIWRRALRMITTPIREGFYLARTFAAAVVKPTSDEVLGGVVSKGPAFAISLIWWSNLFMGAHLLAFNSTAAGAALLKILHIKLATQAPIEYPIAFAAAVGLSLTLEVFHGIWVSTWQNVQNIINRQRGVSYQTFFNLFYMQATAAIFRIITWTVIADTVAPWTLHYWRDMGLVTLIGTFFGTLGYAGLNGLYNKGSLSRRSRSWIQQGRDLFFLVAGTFFASGSMSVYWPIFITQQTLDISLYAWSRFAKARPALYITDRATAVSETFQSMYPVKPSPEISPLKQALEAVLGKPLIKPFVSLARWIWYKVLRRPVSPRGKNK